MNREFKYKPEDCPLKEQHFKSQEPGMSLLCPGCGATSPGAMPDCALHYFEFLESIGRVKRLT